MSTKLKELRGRLEERRQRLARVFEEAGPDLDMDAVTSLSGDTAAKVQQIRALNTEIEDLVKEIEPLEALTRIHDRVGELDAVVRPPMPGREPARTFGELFVESAAYKGWRRGQASGPIAEIDVLPHQMRAALFETGAGWAPESIRTGRVVEMATRPIQIIDIVPEGQTTQAAVVYMEETTATSGAAERAEGGPYAESALQLTERSVTVRSIGTSLPVTDEQLEDVEQARSYVDGRLAFFIRQRLDSQILNGTGVAPQIQGILNAAGLQTQAKGADPVPDAIHKAMTKVRVTGRGTPNAVILHPNDWQDIRLLRTADGIYIWGSPSEPGPARIWGLQVVQSDAIAENTGLVGDFSPAMLQLFFRRGVEVQIGYVADDFTRGKQTIRAGVRAALAVYRPAAFCTVTGI